MENYRDHEDEEYRKATDPAGCYQFMVVCAALAIVIGLLLYTGVIPKIINLFK
jgi:hypothetical protein